MIKRFITAATFGDLEDSLYGEIEEARKGRRYSRITVLVGSNILGRYLKNLLARRLDGIFNIEFVTFPDLLEKIEVRSGLSGKRFIPFQGERVIVEKLNSSNSMPGYFTRIAETGGFREALLRSFTDIDEGIGDPKSVENIPGETGCGERLRALLSYYTAYRRSVEDSGGDIHSRFRAAASAGAEGLLENPLIVYGFYDLNGEQYNLVRSISETSGAIFLTPFADGQEFRFARPLVERCRADGFEMISAEGSSGSRGKETRIELASVHNPEEEIREIAAKIFDHARRGTRFGEMAVILPPAFEISLVIDVFIEAGIPFFTMKRPLLETSRVARSVLRLCRILTRSFDRNDLVEFLVSAPIAHRGNVNGDVDPFSLWVRKSAEAGMTGEKGWQHENGRLEKRLMEAAGRGRESEETVAAIKMVGGLIGRILEARQMIASCRDWKSLSESIADLAGDLFEAGGETEAVKDCVEEIGQLDHVDGPVSASLITAIVESALSRPWSGTGSFPGEGVNILHMGRSRGLRFEIVFVPGLTEDSLPGSTARDPFFRDEDRDYVEQIPGFDARFSRKSRRNEEMALMFNLACSSASKTLVCSHSRLEPGTGREKVPTSFLKYIGFRQDRPDTGPHPVYSRVPGGYARVSSRGPISEDEYFFSLDGENNSLREKMLESSFFSRGIKASAARWTRGELTPYDGVLQSPEAGRKLREIFSEKDYDFSATSLERWARCPFTYFLKNILGVSPSEEPENMVTIDPLQRGTIVHYILENIYVEFEGKGLLPVSTGRRGEILDAAAEIIDACLSDYPLHEPVGIESFWNIEKSRIALAVKGYLESEMASTDDFVPSRFEQAFGSGYGETPVHMDCGSRKVGFHGRIDRVDLADGKYRVIDYKTGQLRGKDNDMGGGVYLQLPVYLLAASHILGMPVARGRAEYRRVASAAAVTSVVFDGERWDETGKQFSKILEKIVDSMEKGMFFPYPDGRGCSYCDLRSACPSSRRLFMEIKSGDGRYASYLEMRRGESPGSE